MLPFSGPRHRTSPAQASKPRKKRLQITQVEASSQCSAPDVSPYGGRACEEKSGGYSYQVPTISLTYVCEFACPAAGHCRYKDVGVCCPHTTIDCVFCKAKCLISAKRRRISIDVTAEGSSLSRPIRLAGCVKAEGAAVVAVRLLYGILKCPQFNLQHCSFASDTRRAASCLSVKRARR